MVATNQSLSEHRLLTCAQASTHFLTRVLGFVAEMHCIGSLFDSMCSVIIFPYPLDCEIGDIVAWWSMWYMSLYLGKE
jgi:hypothetical protein